MVSYAILAVDSVNCGSELARDEAGEDADRIQAENSY
jgi:hypothetical protein